MAEPVTRTPMPQVPIGTGVITDWKKVTFKAFGGGVRGPHPLFAPLLEKAKASLSTHTDKPIVLPVPTGWEPKRLKGTLETQLKRHIPDREYQVRNTVNGELAIMVRDPAVPKRPGPGPRKAK